ncbi:hypothetical protein RintRC_1636 [Richelia intracellularis]|nr:hypothetical protein RintRC_1636 [Richelia intracellularis]
MPNILLGSIKFFRKLHNFDDGCERLIFSGLKQENVGIVES